MWEPERQIFRVFDGDTTISIHGHGLNFGAQMSDYHVNISSSVCNVIELNTGNLVCQPPLELPIHNQQSVDGAYRVSLRVGRISIHVGYLTYYMSRWDDPYFRTPIIATIVTMGAITLSIIIAWVVMKRCYDDPIGHIRQRLHAKPLHQPPPENNYAVQPQRDLIDTLDEDLKVGINIRFWFSLDILYVQYPYAYIFKYQIDRYDRWSRDGTTLTKTTHAGET